MKEKNLNVVICCYSKEINHYQRTCVYAHVFVAHHPSSLAICERCGTKGNSNTFFSRTKRFCSTSCSRSYSSNSKKSSLLARLQVRRSRHTVLLCMHKLMTVDSRFTSASLCIHPGKTAIKESPHSWGREAIGREDPQNCTGW